MAWEFTTYSYHYLLAGFLNIAILSVFMVLLLRNFFKKRTVGTFLLIMTYFCVFLNEVFVTTAFILEGAYPGNEQYLIHAKVLQLTGVFLLVYTINWMYFFANRHLIRDNDLFKSLYTSIFGGVVGAAAGLAYYDAIVGIGDDPIWYSVIELAQTNFNLYYPPLSGLRLILIVAMFLIGTVTYIRLMWRTFVLTRKAKDTVTKKGLRVVTFSVFFLLLTGLILGVYIFGLNEIPWLAAAVYVLRGFIVIAAVVLGYLGWLMPEWLRKRFRGKTWLAKVYTGKIKAPPTSDDNMPQEFESRKFVEISEQ